MATKPPAKPPAPKPPQINMLHLIDKIDDVASAQRAVHALMYLIHPDKAGDCDTMPISRSETALLLKAVSNNLRCEIDAAAALAEQVRA